MKCDFHLFDGKHVLLWMRLLFNCKLFIQKYSSIIDIILLTLLYFDIHWEQHLKCILQIWLIWKCNEINQINDVVMRRESVWVWVRALCYSLDIAIIANSSLFCMLSSKSCLPSIAWMATIQVPLSIPNNNHYIRFNVFYTKTSESASALGFQQIYYI